MVDPFAVRLTAQMADGLIPMSVQGEPDSLVLWTSGGVARSLQIATDMRLARALPEGQNLARLGLILNAHWNYSQWGCIESWPPVEEDKWARPEDLPAWVERGKDLKRFQGDYWDSSSALTSPRRIGTARTTGTRAGPRTRGTRITTRAPSRTAGGSSSSSPTARSRS